MLPIQMVRMDRMAKKTDAEVVLWIYLMGTSLKLPLGGHPTKERRTAIEAAIQNRARSLYPTSLHYAIPCPSPSCGVLLISHVFWGCRENVGHGVSRRRQLHTN